MGRGEFHWSIGLSRMTKTAATRSQVESQGEGNDSTRRRRSSVDGTDRGRLSPPDGQQTTPVGADENGDETPREPTVAASGLRGRNRGGSVGYLS